MTDATDDFRLPARRTLTAADALWVADAGPTKSTALPPDRVRSNPCRAGGALVFVSFSPGVATAFDPADGRQLWRRELGYYGHAPYAPPGSPFVYVGTSKELLALDALTGEVVWRFVPEGAGSGEIMYSQPTVAEGRLFVGDRAGRLHGLDAATGRKLWRVRTSRASNGDVNSTPVVAGGVVAVATNAALALGLDAATGRKLWRRALDGPCSNTAPAGTPDRPELLAWTWNVLSRFAVPNGELVGRWDWPGEMITGACAAGELTLAATRPDDEQSEAPGTLRIYRGGELLRQSPYPFASWVMLLCDSATGLVYESAYAGLGVLDPTTGARVAVVESPDSTGYPRRVSLPLVADGRLYAADDEGRVFAFDHP